MSNLVPFKYENMEFSKDGAWDELIALDRYAIPAYEGYENGDTVVFIQDENTGAKRVGEIKATVWSKEHGTSYKIIDRFGEEHIVREELMHLPLETRPSQMWSRWAKGGSSVEDVLQKEYWGNNFRKLFDGYRYSLGGRIQLMLGQEFVTGEKAQLTAYNCYVGASPKSYENSCEQFVEGIEVAYKEASIMRRGGGEGINISTFNTIKGSGAKKENFVFYLDRNHKDYQELLIRSRLGKFDNVKIVRSQDEYVELYDKAVESSEKVREIVAVDSIADGLFDNMKEMTRASYNGETVFVDFNSLRHRKALVKSVNGRSSGAVSWMELFVLVASIMQLDEIDCVDFAEIFSFIVGLIEQGGCVAPYSQIATNKGLMSAKDVYDSEEELFALTHKGFKKIVHRFDNGEKNVLKVTTSNGYELDASEDHKFLVMNSNGETNMVKMSDMQEGDNVFILLNDKGSEVYKYVSLDSNKKEESKMTTNKKECNLPDVLEEKLAFMLGYYGANGSLVKSGEFKKGVSFSIPNNRPELFEKLQTYALDIFGVHGAFEDGCGDCRNFVIRSVDVVHFFENNDFLKPSTYDLEVPKQVFMSPISVIENYVGGFFAGDGCNKGKKAGLTICTTSKTFAKQYQKLLLQLGVPSKLSTEQPKEENWHEKYVVAVTSNKFATKFSSVLTPHTSKVNDKEQSDKNMSFVLPVSLYERFKYVKGFSRKCASNAKNTSQTAIDFLYENYNELKGEDKDFVELLHNSIVDSVESIESVGVMNVYDFEVEDVHMLSFDGLYTSNSRRGALMLICNVDKKEVRKFIERKKEKDNLGKGKWLTGANISVGIDDTFMANVKYAKELLESGAVISGNLIDALYLWDLLVQSAWQSAEPGIVWLERCNKESNSWYFSPLIATNPCGEQPLPAWGVCNLGHHVLSRYFDGELANKAIVTRKVADEFSDFYYPKWDELVAYSQVDWDALAEGCRYAVRLQDNIIDYTPYFLDENREIQLQERRVGIGSMALATLMIHLQLQYGSDKGNKFVDTLYKFIAYHTYNMSMDIAEEKGAFPAYEYGKFIQSGFMKRLLAEFPYLDDKLQETGIRNVTLLTQAPTGSTATYVDNIPEFVELFGGTSTGIEPYFAFKYWRAGRLGFTEQVCQIAQQYMDKNGITDVEDLPEWFVTAMDLEPSDHVTVQASIQKWTDSAISKTANCPNEYTVEQTDELYMQAYDMGLKGFTVYRDGSRDAQVLATNKEDAKIESHIEAEAMKKLQEADTDTSDNAGVLTLEKFNETVEMIANVTATSAQLIGDSMKSLVSKIEKRPARLFGFTDKVKVPFGDNMVKAYININVDEEGQPFEVFITSNTPEFEQMASVIGRFVTKELRSGESIENIVKNLRKGQTLATMPAKLATLLEQVSYGKIEFPFAKKPKVKKAVFQKCSACGEMAFDKGGCICVKCGYSKCN